MNATTISKMLSALREIKDRYHWSYDGGNIVGRLNTRSRTGINPMVALMRVAFNSPRLRSTRYNSMMLIRHGFPFDPHNTQDFTRACRRPGRRGHNRRERWIRKLVCKALGLEPNDE